GFRPEALDLLSLGHDLSELSGAELRPGRAHVRLPNGLDLEVRPDRLSMHTHHKSRGAAALARAFERLRLQYEDGRFHRVELYFALVAPDAPGSRRFDVLRELFPTAFGHD